MASAGTSAAVDLYMRRVPNPITISAAALGLMVAVTGVGRISLGGALAGFVMGLIVMLPGHLFGGTGSGDVKLMAALGTWLGPSMIVKAFLYSAIAGGVFALIVAIRRRRLAATLRGAAQLVSAHASTKGTVEAADRDNRFPYAPAISRKRAGGARALRGEVTMNRIRMFAVLVLAITAGGGLAFATYNYIQNAPVKTVSLPTRPVIVAAQDLELGSELKQDDLRVVEWPANAVPNGAFSKTDELTGRGLLMPVIQNEPILPMKLASKEAGAGLPPLIPAGLRAVSVRVNEVIGVAGYVLPGTRVDVVATANPTEQRADMTSKVVLTNVLVLAAGTKFEQASDKGEPQPVSVVTLLVTPEESERLTLASTEGKIQLALRNPLDNSAPVTPGIKPAALLGTPARTAAVRMAAMKQGPTTPVQTVQMAPEPLPTVEVIRGDKRAQEVVR
jgi:pilus assembly protein CpaB